MKVQDVTKGLDYEPTLAYLGDTRFSNDALVRQCGSISEWV